MNNVYKIKKTSTGGERAIKKDDRFNPPAEKQVDFTRLEKAQEVLFEGAKILGTDIMLKWQKMEP